MMPFANPSPESGERPGADKIEGIRPISQHQCDFYLFTIVHILDLLNGVDDIIVAKQVFFFVAEHQVVAV